MRAALLSILLVFPSVVFGEVIFSEIMYDPKGSDTDREWVELYNNGNSPVDLSEKSAKNPRYSRWRFREKDSASNHSLTLISGNAVIEPGGYAVITNANSALTDFPGYEKTLLTGSFSLLNSSTDVTMAFRDDNLDTDVATAIYSKVLGATEDGNSLQIDALGKFFAAEPAPGSGFMQASTQTNGNTGTAPAAAAETPAATDPGNGISGQANSSWAVEPQIFANAGKDRTVIVGAAVVFDGKAYGLKKEPLDNARFIWNFGDGSTKEGKMVEHTYRYPGDYVAVLDVASGYYSAMDQLKVRAEPSRLSLSSITDGKDYFIEIYNSSNSSVDISGWWFALDLPAASSTAQAGSKTFEIPKNTFVAGGKKLVFVNEVTGLLVTAGSVPELRYPNGLPAFRFGDVKPASKPAAAGTIVTAVEKFDADTPPIVEDKKIDEPEVVSESKAENLSAAAAPKSSASNYLWLMGVLGIAIAAVSGIFLARWFEKQSEKESGLDEEIEKLAREIEIIE